MLKGGGEEQLFYWQRFSIDKGVAFYFFVLTNKEEKTCC